MFSPKTDRVRRDGLAPVPLNRRIGRHFSAFGKQQRHCRVYQGVTGSPLASPI
jgi:hypothetical protein